MTVSNKSKVWYLERVNIFAGLTPQDMQEIDRISQMIGYRRGELIFLRGELARAIYVVKEGTVKLSVMTPEGREVTLALIGAGDLLGDLPLFGSETEECDAVALTDVLLCKFSAAAFELLISYKPQVALMVIRALGDKLREVRTGLEAAHTKSVNERLALALVKLAEQHGFRTRLGVGINLRLTHEELAKMVGAARETVSATMSKWKQEGILTYDHHRILIKELPRLRELAKL